MTYVPVDVIIDNKTKQKHRIDTLNLLAYVTLLVLVLVTTWFLKRRKRLLIHETGLAIIYGLFMGAALKYFGLKITISYDEIEDKSLIDFPRDYLLVGARQQGDINANKTHTYAYEFRGELSDSYNKTAKLTTQLYYASLDPEIFFNIILPPIVLNAGLSLKRRHFFRNIGAIFSYAFIGTTISVAVVGLLIYQAINIVKLFYHSTNLVEQFSLTNCLYFGAIISPTDPLAVLAIFQEFGVDVNLFALVFGESILNDAVSIVLTHSIDQFSVIYSRNPYYSIYLLIWECVYNFISMFFTSCIVGIAFGIVTALTTKFTKLTESPLLETSLLVLMSYSSFLTAEAIDTSGIVAILLCGITQAHYTINNLSFEAREQIKNLFELLTFLCENFLFLAVGVSFWQRGQTWDFTFIGIACVAVTIARAISIYPLTYLLNLGRRNKIPMNFQHIIAWGGGARGVISYSLAARNTNSDARRIMLSTTSTIVIISILTIGSSIGGLLKLLKIPFNETGQDNNDKILSPTNNPSWLVRPKRLNRINLESSRSNQTPISCKTRANRRQLSIDATPILEVDTDSSEQVNYNNNNINNNQSQHHQQQASVDMNLSNTIVGDYNQADILPTVSEIDDRKTNVLNQDAGLPSTSNDLGVSDCSFQIEHPYENACIVRRWRQLDNNVIKPLLTNSHPTLMETMPPKLRALARWFTSDEQLMCQAGSQY